MKHIRVEMKPTKIALEKHEVMTYLRNLFTGDECRLILFALTGQLRSLHDRLEEDDSEEYKSFVQRRVAESGSVISKILGGHTENELKQMAAFLDDIGIVHEEIEDAERFNEKASSWIVNDLLKKKGEEK